MGEFSPLFQSAIYEIYTHKLYNIILFLIFWANFPPFSDESLGSRLPIYRNKVRTIYQDATYKVETDIAYSGSIHIVSFKAFPKTEEISFYCLTVYSILAM